MKGALHVVLKTLETWKSKMNLVNKYGKSNAIIAKNFGIQIDKINWHYKQKLTLVKYYFSIDKLWI